MFPPPTPTIEEEDTPHPRIETASSQILRRHLRNFSNDLMNPVNSPDNRRKKRNSLRRTEVLPIIELTINLTD